MNPAIRVESEVKLLSNGTAATGAQSYAPIVLFVYNRPAHTKQTVEALQRNDLATASELFIYSDAPRSAAESNAVQEVRTYIRSIIGFRTVSIVERQENWGLARSIIDGVSHICGKYGRVIVLEDDLICSPYFLAFMNDALALYADDLEVMHISGSTFPVATNEDVCSYFLHIPLCWGWATWNRAWSHFRKDVKVMDRFDRKTISRFNFDNTLPNYWRQLEANRDGRIDTWFIFWYATVFLLNGLALFPRQSLLQNIGMDGTGVHCNESDAFKVELSTRPIQLRRILLEESAEAFERHRRYFRSIRPSWRAKLLEKARRAINGRAR